MGLNLDNDQNLNAEVHRIANGTGSTYDKAQQLKQFVEDQFYNDEFGIIKICDIWTERDFQEIDWTEIVESHIEESDENAEVSFDDTDALSRALKRNREKYGEGQN